MSSVPKGGQTHHQSTHDKAQMAKMHPQERARDDLKGAFAGDQNENESAHAPHGEHGHDTHVKSRNTKESKTRTPKI
ncbi:MAG: hypothetical protein V4760_09750 [Bdellovibrionota bacterium]